MIGNRDNPAVRRWEWISLASVLVAAGIFVFQEIRGYWFHYLDWTFLTLDPMSLDLFRPVLGHLNAIPMVAYKAMFGAFGMDYFPWFVLFRVVGYTLMVLVLWLIMRRRGANPVFALLAAAYLAVFASTVDFKVLSIGVFVAVPALLVSAYVIDRRPRPQRREAILVVALLFAAILCNANGGIGVVGLAVAVLLSRERRRWLPFVGTPASAFALYALANRDDVLTPEARTRSLFEVAIDMPADLADSAANVWESVARVDAVSGWLVLVAAAVLLGWAASRGVVGFFEASTVSMSVVYLASVAVNRAHFFLSDVQSDRYSNTPALLLIPAFVPLFRMPRSSVWRAVVVLVGCLLVAGQVRAFHEDAKPWADLGNDSAKVIAMRRLIINGEPYIDGRGLPTGALPYHLRELKGASGWGEPLAQFVPVARGRLRVATIPSDAAGSRVISASTPSLAGGRELASCERASGEMRVELELKPGLSRLQIVPLGASRPVAALRTDDRFGPGVTTFPVPGRRGVLVVAPDEGPTTLSIEPRGGAIDVCPWVVEEK